MKGVCCLKDHCHCLVVQVSSYICFFIFGCINHDTVHVTATDISLDMQSNVRQVEILLSSKGEIDLSPFHLSVLIERYLYTFYQGQ